MYGSKNRSYHKGETFASVAYLKILLDLGADLLAVSDDGKNVLHISCIYGMFNFVNYILKQLVENEKIFLHHEEPSA